MNTPQSTAGLLTAAHKAQLSAILGKPDYFGGRYRMGWSTRKQRAELVRIKE